MKSPVESPGFLFYPSFRGARSASHDAQLRIRESILPVFVFWR
jgi:hypothetical protein